MNSPAKAHIFIITILILCIVSGIFGQSTDNYKPQDNIRTIADTPLEFNSWESDLISSEIASEIRIGLFLPDKESDHLSRSINDAAALAIDEFNEMGGYKGIPYRLIRRWTSDPWKAGSKEVIRLVYQDSVIALIGSINGMTTHVAEQIATKAWIPLLSPVSADPTLTQIRIPWIFRLTPDFANQSKIIVRDGLNHLSINRVGIICSADHDGNEFAQAIQKALANENRVASFQFTIPSGTQNYNRIVQRSRSFEVEALIILLAPDQVKELIEVWEQDEHSVAFFLPWIPGMNEDIVSTLRQSKLYVIRPFQTENNPAHQLFVTRYKKHFGYHPPAAAAYTYDALRLIKDAVEQSGLNRPGVRDAIATVAIKKGVTGEILWDNTGGNVSQPVLQRID